MRLRHRFIEGLRPTMQKNAAEQASATRMKVAAPVPGRRTLLVVRDGIDSRLSNRVSEVLLTTNTGDPDTRRSKIRPSTPYWMSDARAPARRAGEGKARLSTRGALESVTGIVHMIRTATVPSAKTRFRPCEQRCFGPPASAPGTGLVKVPRAARCARRAPTAPALSRGGLLLLIPGL